MSIIPQIINKFWSQLQKQLSVQFKIIFIVSSSSLPIYFVLIIPINKLQSISFYSYKNLISFIAHSLKAFIYIVSQYYIPIMLIKSISFNVYLHSNLSCYYIELYSLSFNTYLSYVEPFMSNFNIINLLKLPKTF